MTNFLLALITLNLLNNNHNDVNMSPGALKAGLLLWGGIILFIAVVCFFGFELVLGFSGVVLVLLSLEKAGIFGKRKIEKMKEEPVKDESTKKGIHPIYNFLLFVFGLAFAVVLLMFYAETRP